MTRPSRPWAPAPVKERPTVVVPPVSPVRDSPLRASPIRMSPLRASPLRDNPLRGPSCAQSGTGPSPFRLPFRRPGKGKVADKRRNIIIVPSVGKRAPRRSDRLFLPYDEICRVMEWEFGSFTYVPGMGEEFTTLGQWVVHQEENWGELECDHLREGWCLLGDEDEHGDFPEHMHPFGCMPIGRGSTDPLYMSVNWDSHSCEMHDRVTQDLWAEWDETFRAGRELLLGSPGLLLDNPALRGTVAASVLKAAGFSFEGTLHLVDKVVETLRYFLGVDDTVRHAFADYGMHAFSNGVDELPDLDSLTEALYNKDAYVLGPDELTFLAFDPEDFPLAGGGIARLLGDWICVETVYHSFYPDNQPNSEAAGAIAWRECLMKRVSDVDLDELGNVAAM